MNAKELFERFRTDLINANNALSNTPSPQSIIHKVSSGNFDMKNLTGEFFVATGMISVQSDLYRLGQFFAFHPKLEHLYKKDDLATFLNEAKTNPDAIIQITDQFLDGKFGAAFSNQQPDKLIVEFYNDLHTDAEAIHNTYSAMKTDKSSL